MVKPMIESLNILDLFLLLQKSKILRKIIHYGNKYITLTNGLIYMNKNDNIINYRKLSINKSNIPKKKIEYINWHSNKMIQSTYYKQLIK